jgi:hypothetical protein
MKKTNIFCIALSFAVLSSCNNSATTEENNPSTNDSAKTSAEVMEAPPLDSAAAAKAWEAYMTPGEMHKEMAASNGNWEAEIVFWMAPEAPPTPPSKTSVVTEMIFGGRYQKSTYSGQMMGMPFEGESITAYDNAKKKFISTWIDNTGTGLMYMEGDYNAADKAIVLTGKMTDPTTGKDKDIRQVLKTIDDKNQVLEMYDVQNGKEFKSMEIKLVRK